MNRWPNKNDWVALSNDIVVRDDVKCQLSTISCGKLKMPSGQLIVCDPFAAMSKAGNAFTQIPAGAYDVIVTLADVSPNLDGSHIREAYSSLILDDSSPEVRREFLHLTLDGKSGSEAVKDNEFFGFGVDAGTACFVDAKAILEGMPEPEEWYSGLFENEDENSWFNQMDNPDLIRPGLANIELPHSKEENNLILFHSGWGDGYYPVIGGYNQQNKLVAVHIDFFVVSGPDEQQEEVLPTSKPWWKLW